MAWPYTKEERDSETVSERVRRNAHSFYRFTRSTTCACACVLSMATLSWPVVWFEFWFVRLFQKRIALLLCCCWWCRCLLFPFYFIFLVYYKFVRLSIGDFNIVILLLVQASRAAPPFSRQSEQLVYFFVT